MNPTVMTLEQIRLTGLKALSRDLGPVGLVRFLQQFETGHGDYTAERHRWLGEPTVQYLAQEIERQRETTGDSPDDRQSH
ncbi:MAG: hypothetical protein ACETWR_06480 [Anaerolineae bacterium]|jgi:hypothetical protein